MKVGFGAARRMLALALMASLFVGLVPATASALTERQIRNRLYEKVNTARENRGIDKLGRNDKTAYWARDHSKWLANNCTPETILSCHDNGAEIESELPSDWSLWGENLAMHDAGKGVVSKLHAALMDSPLHKANILERDFSHMGFGVIKRDGEVWVTQRFVFRDPRFR